MQSIDKYEQPYFPPAPSRFLLDRILNAGFLGEIAVGVIFGSPLTGILLNDWQQTFLVLGYIGLLLIVFEGDTTCSLV